MRSILVCTLASFLLSFLLCAALIPLLKRLGAGQNILHYVKEHKSKGGTPTMGGLAFILAASVIALIANGVADKPFLVALAVGDRLPRRGLYRRLFKEGTERQPRASSLSENHLPIRRSGNGKRILLSGRAHRFAHSLYGYLFRYRLGNASARHFYLHRNGEQRQSYGRVRRARRLCERGLFLLRRRAYSHAGAKRPAL